MPRTERDREKERRRKHAVQLKKFEARFRKATNQADRLAIAAKVRRFSPMINLEERAAAALAAAKATPGGKPAAKSASAASKAKKK